MSRTLRQIRADNERKTHRDTIMAAIQELGQVTVADLVEDGLDISVARRALKELTEDNKIWASPAGENGALVYKSNGVPLYLQRWVSSPSPETETPAYC